MGSLLEMSMTSTVFTPHPIGRLLGKPMSDVTSDDLVRAVEELELRQVNLRYVGGDGRLKTIAFAVDGREHLIDQAPDCGYSEVVAQFGKGESERLTRGGTLHGAVEFARQLS